MKGRITSIFVVIFAMISAPGGAANAVVSTVKEAVVSRESPEEHQVRENAEIEKATDQVLVQYPEDHRQQTRREVIDQMARVALQVEAMEARQEAVRAQQGGIGGVILDAASSAIKTTISNRVTSDAAVRAATIRARF